MNTNKTAILIAASLSIVLYILGVFSGLYANKILEDQTTAQINELQANVKNIDRSVIAFQLEQAFVQTLGPENSCAFSEIALDDVVSELEVFWNQLPQREEERNTGSISTEEYERIIDQFTTLTLRAWILARDVHKRCDDSILPVLYFYKYPCETCTSQDIAVQQYKESVKLLGKKAVTFAIDIDHPSPAIRVLTTYYDIRDAPAVILYDTVHQGNITTTEELIDAT